jgi:hypothetical protein
MIDLINEIESHDLLWSVRRCNIEGERVYRAVVWSAGASPCVIVSQEASSPSLALGFAFSKAKTELGIPQGPAVRVTAPTPGSFRALRERVASNAQYGTSEPVEPARDLDA